MRSRPATGASASRRWSPPGAVPWTRVVPFFAFPPDVRRVILHDQRNRERACAPAQDHQDPRPLPQRRGRHQADLAGAAEHHRRVEPRVSALEGGDEPVRDNLRRPIHAGSLKETSGLNRLTHKKSDTPPRFLPARLAKKGRLNFLYPQS